MLLRCHIAQFGFRRKVLESILPHGSRRLHGLTLLNAIDVWVTCCEKRVFSANFHIAFACLFRPLECLEQVFAQLKFMVHCHSCHSCHSSAWLMAKNGHPYYHLLPPVHKIKRSSSTPTQIFFDPLKSPLRFRHSNAGLQNVFVLFSQTQLKHMSKCLWYKFR